jgi:hypothetical protein
MGKEEGNVFVPFLQSFTGAKVSDTLIIIQIKIALISIYTFGIHDNLSFLLFFSLLALSTGI